MSILFYRRPDYVSKSHGPLNQRECQRYVERTANGKRGIPEELSFENVITNKAMPPCQLRDFMDYLVYVTHDAENLQFYLWLQDYTQRFNPLKPERKALAPEWKEQEQDAEEKAAQIAAVTPGGMKRKKKPGPLMPKVDFDKPADAAAIGLTEIVISPKAEVLSEETVQEMNDEANAQAGLKWQGFSVQPLRQEIDRVIAHYIAQGAPRELNLSARDRSAVLHALQHTTHPSAFKIVADMVEATLRGQAHPNFVRWSICNGNKPRVFFVRTMGVTHIAGGLLIGLLLLLSSTPRWWRILMFPVLFLGTTTMIAAYKGLCVILHRGHKRSVKPWEDEDSINSGITGATATSNTSDSKSLAVPNSIKTKTSTSTFDYDEEATLNGGSKAASLKRPYSMDSFGSSNSFDSEAWVAEYQRKPLVQKIWDAETWVQEESVRVIQDKIVKGAQLWSLILTTATTAIFLALPGVCLY
ncbi:putative regulator of g protein signaling superfamily protein [Neofusicoccum parvum UCRNP2]|uniref:Putative regulator of g protein signaling superfamily protein n=1 Tax=Botryosphaeria parva (strain UCR-NP2) TaxID=1287680 RepID=R1GK02_BOTPV|nr:putative regulator of g protein signaling superfamily protein [Neofusicoccum parvum UCRNP2]